MNSNPIRKKALKNALTELYGKMWPDDIQAIVEAASEIRQIPLGSISKEWITSTDGGKFPEPEELDGGQVDKGAIGSTVEEVGAWLSQKWSFLEQRYGRGPALTMAVGMLATLPLPGNITAIVAVAEAIRGIHGYFKSFDSASDDEINDVSTQLSSLKPGRVIVIMGRKCKKDKLGYVSLDGAPPVAVSMAIKRIFNDEKSLKAITVQKTSGPHSYASTQFNVADVDDGTVGDALQAMQDAIPDELLADDGKEDQYHLTALYGLIRNDCQEVASAVAGFGPVKVVFGSTSIFPSSDNDSQRGGDAHDVVKVDVSSPDLIRLNKLLREQPNVNKFPKYVPHLTLAYVKAGEGEQFAGNDGVKGMELTFDKLIFSPAEGDKVAIKLTGAKRKSLPPSNGDGRLNGHAKQLKALAKALPKEPEWVSVEGFSLGMAEKQAAGDAEKVAAIVAKKVKEDAEESWWRAQEADAKWNQAQGEK
jgi:hypothetical protein